MPKNDYVLVLPSQCLWLRCRLVLVKCVGEAVALTGGLTPERTTNPQATEKGPSPGPSAGKESRNCEGRGAVWPGAERNFAVGEDCVFRGEVSALVEKGEEFEATLAQMDQHIGVLFLRETLKQGSEVSWWM